MLSNTTLERLKTARFIATGAQPSVGMGERRSREKGMGLEFVDHRPYREGDDTRHLDARLLARLDEHYLRQYSVDKRLPIYVLIDGSASMRYGEPDKFVFAKALAQALGFIGLNGGDQVQLGLYANGRIEWSPNVHGAAQLHQLAGWIDARQAGGAGNFSEALRLAARDIRSASLLILISDWWTESPRSEMRALAARANQVLAFHIGAPQELDPSGLGDGPLDLVDCETGEEVELSIDSEMLGRYRKAIGEWQEHIKQLVTSAQGRYFPLASNADLEHLCTRQLRTAGVIA